MTLNTPSSFPLGRLAALALVTVLASCGGFTAVSIGGTVTNLTGTGLTIANAGKSLAIPAGATSFTFPDQVEIRSPYSVSVVTQPAQQTCNIFNTDGIAGAAPVTIVNIQCSANVYFLGGTITGLKGANLKLTNGSDQLLVAAGATTFTMPLRVADGSVYGVTVLAQPDGQSCAVTANGTGTMQNADRFNVQVTCQ